MHEFSLETSVEEMDEADLRSTLDEFMEKHEENVADYEALVSERDEFSEKGEELEGDLETAQTYFAEKASDYTHLDAEVIVERFSLSETIEMAGEAEEAAFSEEAPEAADEPEAEAEGEGEGSVFADKPDRAPTGTEAKSAFRKQAEDDLKTILGDF